MENIQLINRKNQNNILNVITQEINFPDDVFSKVIDSQNIYVIENPNCNPIKIIYNNEKVKIKFIHKTPRANEKKMYELFKEKYVRSFSKIAQIFSNVPFVIFGDYIPDDKIVMYDMYINDNWIAYEDFSNIILTVKANVPRTLYHGLYNEDIIKKVMASITSSTNPNKNIDCVFVKSEMEVRFGKNNKRLGVILSTWMPHNKKEKKETKERARNIINTYFVFGIEDSIVLKWEQFLKTKNISISSKNKGAILSRIINWTLFDMELEIIKLAEFHSIKEELLKDAIKSCLPKFVIKKLNL